MLSFDANINSAYDKRSIKKFKNQILHVAVSVVAGLFAGDA
jgi:hypothetical protein